MLIVEDSENDAQLLMRELKRCGYEPDYERVETPEAMEKCIVLRVLDDEHPERPAAAFMGWCYQGSSPSSSMLTSPALTA